MAAIASDFGSQLLAGRHASGSYTGGQRGITTRSGYVTNHVYKTEINMNNINVNPTRSPNFKLLLLKMYVKHNDILYFC